MCPRATDITREWADITRWELKTGKSLLIPRDVHRQNVHVGAVDAAWC